jgi:hypothetical protein
MLILDVKTRWSSTHQMLRKQALLVIHQLLITLSVGRALDYRLVIDDFVAKNKDLRNACRRLGCYRVGGTMAKVVQVCNNSNVNNEAANAVVNTCHLLRPPGVAPQIT